MDVQISFFFFFNDKYIRKWIKNAQRENAHQKLSAKNSQQTPKKLTNEHRSEGNKKP